MASDPGERLWPSIRVEGARDLLVDLEQAQVVLGLIVVEPEGRIHSFQLGERSSAVLMPLRYTRCASPPEQVLEADGVPVGLLYVRILACTAVTCEFWHVPQSRARRQQPADEL